MSALKTFLRGILIVLVILSCTKKKEPDPEETKPDESDTANTEIFTSIEHDIRIITYEGEPVFWNDKNDEQFIPRGVNYFRIIPTSVGLQDRFFGVGIFDENRTR